MHSACQHAVFYVGKTCQVRFQVRATSLDAVPMAFPQLLCWRLFCIIAFSVLETFQGEAFEEIVNVFVVGSFALRMETAGEEERIHPVLQVMDDAVFHQGGVYAEAIAAL